ncbi:MAG: radical SAM protein [Candidatus Bathyarchaeia archaeon]
MRVRSILRFAYSFVSYKLGRPKLSYVIYLCTARCNLRCHFCNLWRERRPELETEDALKIMKELADFGVAVIGFTGGEPTMWRDLEKLSSTARSLGVFTSLSTNGTMINRRRARKIGKSFDIVNVSLDGFKEVHDSVRGIPGTFEAAMRGIKNLKESGVKVGICLTIHNKNFHQVLDVVKFFRVLGCCTRLCRFLGRL